MEAFGITGVRFQNSTPVHGCYVNIPTSISKHPADMPVAHPPSETAKRGYNVVRLRQCLEGTFAAMEQPELLRAGYSEAFRPYRN
jgi:hypothetical protein